MGCKEVAGERLGPAQPPRGSWTGQDRGDKMRADRVSDVRGGAHTGRQALRLAVGFTASMDALACHQAVSREGWGQAAQESTSGASGQQRCKWKARLESYRVPLLKDVPKASWMP